MQSINKKYVIALVAALVLTVLGHGALRAYFLAAERKAALGPSLRGEPSTAYRVPTPRAAYVLKPEPPVVEWVEPIEHRVEWNGGRYETSAGFSLEIPAGANIAETAGPTWEELGDVRKVVVTDSQGGLIASARLQDAEYGIEVADGCCMYFQGELDLSGTDAEVRATLERSLRNVYGLRRIVVDGRDAVRFWNVFAYVEGGLIDNVIVPTEDERFPTLHFTQGSGLLWGVSTPKPIITDDNVDELVPDRAAARRMDDMLSDIRFIPIKAQ